jgi:apolipoprotein N-acyltransferase
MINVCYSRLMRLKNFGKRHAGAILSGFLIGVALLGNLSVPWLYALVFVAYLPLWNSWLGEESPRAIFFKGWIAQAILSLVAFNWVAYTLREFSRIPWPAAILGLGLFCTLSYLYIPVGGLLWRILFPPRVPRWLRITGLVLVSAIAERLYPVIFDWHLGYSWLPLGGWAIQAADLFGFAGLGTITLVLNGFLLACWLGRREGWRQWLLPFASAVGIYALLCGYGYFRVLSLPTPDRIARALLVQANIGNKQKHEAEHGESFRDAIVARYLALSRQGIAELRGKADFIVWPETAFPDFILPYRYAGAHFDHLQEFLREVDVPLLTGAYSFSKEGKAANSFFALNPKDPWRSDYYEKSRLLAFGEYLPGAAWFPSLLSFVPGARDFGKGSGPKLLAVNEISVGPQICYEGLFDEASRQSAELGAQILINLTNDSWYGNWQQPWQHLYMSLGRAIETRRPYLRATNTGISSVMLANGREMERSPVGREWVHDFDIPYRAKPSPTFFMATGYWCVPAILWVALAFAVVVAQVKFRRLAV